MHAVAEEAFVDVREFSAMEVWAQSLGWMEAIAVRRGHQPNGGSYPMPVLNVKFSVPAYKVRPLLTLFPNSVDESTEERALSPRLYTDGFACTVPEGLEEGSPAYRRWKEFCVRAEREYVIFAKTLADKEMAVNLLPACVAHVVTAQITEQELIQAILRVFSYFADNDTKALRTVFRKLITHGEANCPTLFHTFYNKFCERGEEDDAEMAGEGEGAGEEV